MKNHSWEAKKKRIVLTQFYVTIKMSMDNFVSQGEARERATRSCNARIIRFDETEGETAQQLLNKVNSQVL
jgi:hypothetical protein